MKFSLALILLLFFGFVFSSCSGSDGGGPAQKTAEQLTTEGWQAYGAKNYQDALARFTEALQLNGNFADAHNGAGWANAKLNAMDAAVTSFTTGLTKDPANLQMKAGLAFVYSVQKNYALSIQRTQEVLAADSSWSFSRDLSISASDLHLLLAADYFAQGNFGASLQEVRLLESFTVNVNTASGQAALSDEIEKLRTRV
ncbi:MAG: tetratricopeptide repeat protein [Ignavibacteriae bacterium]|nr:tetratricopeptide repeat protein [Ignavibacteriota bacterium]